MLDDTKEVEEEGLKEHQAPRSNIRIRLPFVHGIIIPRILAPMSVLFIGLLIQSCRSLE
ncbi:hypothetical protein BJ165DRAFT_1493254 [Panaeolus papilionaceus]|nr:hypothetical protein BJ165DRAFT_1493094 [Panaeolus papilionaceus]KAF9040917.1 hypothetical protein BJ165DRAFT_1493172 [Panaeolus papilionaceus]KAF9040924.1 hypothetical protein BJ165DRAFT_1493254 [Panaeolus papilionaceus]